MIEPARWKHLTARYDTARPRRMLALDGGGIRGILTLCMLEKIEQIVGKRLCDYFDYIAGTSTGAIIAAGLARGKSVAELVEFYQTAGPEMFQRSHFLQRLKSLYLNGNLQQKLQTVFGNATLEPEHLQTLVLLVTRNVTTDSPWPVSSNPDGRYNDCTRPDCNLKIPLWQLVRASTAAPIFFPPEVIEVDPTDAKRTFVFVDGGVTPYNNPAFALFRFATDPAYRLEWPTGEQNLLLISVGTGSAPALGATADDPDSNMLSTGIGIPTALMYGASVDQDVNCRTIGRCTHGAPIDRELLDMVPRSGGDAGTVQERLARPAIPLTTDLGRAFLYARYNVDLSPDGLAALGRRDVDSAAVQKMDNVTPENVRNLFAIGRAAAAQVTPAHFGSFL